jgi:hypothetical protein
MKFFNNLGPSFESYNNNNGNNKNMNENTNNVNNNAIYL